MNPAEHLRVALALQRRRGIKFDLAWDAAIRSLPKGSCHSSRRQMAEWREVFRWAKPAFQDAYHGECITRLGPMSQDGDSRTPDGDAGLTALMKQLLEITEFEEAIAVDSPPVPPRVPEPDDGFKNSFAA